MQRTPEPEELMNGALQAEAYAAADFSEANRLFIDLLQQMGDPRSPMLDLGCGPAHIPIALLRQHKHLRLDALDGAAAMLDIARENARAARVAQRLSLRQELLSHNALPSKNYHSIISNSLLHHLTNPAHLWHTVRRCAGKGATVLVMDLARPKTAWDADQLVETYAAGAHEILREDFRNSLHAAYELEEVAEQLREHALATLEVAMVSDRHWAVSGHLP